MGRWDFLINHEKRRTTFEITSAIALACQEIVKQKGNKKLSKNLWDIGKIKQSFKIFYSIDETYVLVLLGGLDGGKLG